MSSDLTRQLERANELAGLGRDTQAMELLLQLLRAHPEAAGAIEICLSRAHLLAGRAAEGKEHALRAITAEPNAYAGHLLLGIALHMLRRPAEAVTPLQTAMRLDHQDSDPPQRLAQVLTDLGRLEEAYAAAGEALRRDPHAAKNHFAMGYVLHESNQAEATRAYRKALELDPQHTAAKHNLAGVAVQRGDWVAGSRGMATVLADNPQAKTPLFILDQRIVGMIRWQHWLLVGTFLGYGMVSGGERPLVSLLWLVAMIVVGGFLAVKGVKPIRAALPEGGSRFLRTFPRRDVIATIWGGCLVLGWLCLLGATIVALVHNPQTLWAGMATFVFLLLGMVLSWVRVPVAWAKAERLRHSL